jgi:cell division protein FtsQ
MTTTSVRPRPTPRIDPRIRARRVAVRRDEGRRRLRRLLVLVAVAALAGLAFLATRSPLLDVDHVRTDGATHTSPDALLAAAGIRRGAPMTGVDLAGAERAIAALPWIDTVRVERDWPGSVEIHVTERVAAATMLTATGEWYLLDGTGRVLERVDAPAAERPTIAVGTAAAAPGATQAGVAGALEVVRHLTPELQVWVQALQPAADGTVDLLLQGAIRVELGSQAHLSDKVGDLATVLSRVDLTDLVTIDVSVAHNPVLTRNPA